MTLEDLLPLKDMLPQPGFYHRYKQRPEDPPHLHAIEVTGLSVDASMKGASRAVEEAVRVHYRPLDSTMLVCTLCKELGLPFADSKPLGEFLAPVGGGPRYRKITDPDLLIALSQMAAGLYPRDTHPLHIRMPQE